MKKIFKFLPVYGIIPILSLVGMQLFCYLTTSAISAGFPKHDLTTVFDLYVPFSAWWIIIYYGWMVFIAAYFIVADVYSKRAVYRLVSVCIITYVLLFAFYLIYPTTNIRLPEYSDDGFFGIFVNLLYGMDRPSNLFPSIHVFVSWMCWIAVRTEKNIPLWIRTLALNLAILICVSTQTLKQHYFLDVVSGILLAEGMNLIVVYALKLDRVFERFFTFINVKLKLEPPEEYEKFLKKKAPQNNA